MDNKQPSPQPPLSSSQKKQLRRYGHDLSPVIIVGKEGLSDTVITAIDTALTDHELIKVKLISASPVSKHEAAATIPQATASALVQLIGKTLLLFRRNPKKKKEQQIMLV